MRQGDTGVGYTFESLVGVRENNDQGADFGGIEIKCTKKKDRRVTASKTNLFQLAPAWATHQSGIERLRQLGRLNDDGRWACYSQVTTTTNNLGLSLDVQPPPTGVGLWKNMTRCGTWSRERLAERLAEKHSRAVFVASESRNLRGEVQYRYNGLVYCERPDVNRFIDMVDARRIVFEFTMHEDPPGRVRNHGYPWRLVDQRDLDQLFAFQVRLRG